MSTSRTGQPTLPKPRLGNVPRARPGWRVAGGPTNAGATVQPSDMPGNWMRVTVPPPAMELTEMAPLYFSTR